MVPKTKLANLSKNTLTTMFNEMATDKERYIFLKNVGGIVAQKMHTEWVATLGQTAVDAKIAAVEAENGDEIHSGIVLIHTDGKPIVYDGKGDVVTNLKDYKAGEKPSAKLATGTFKMRSNK